MSEFEPVWQFPSLVSVDAEFMQAVKAYVPNSDGQFAAQLLWKRGIQTIEQLEPFINPEAYQQTFASAFGDEMDRAIARLQLAYESGEAISIWGDFDADGVTATSVLWEGFGQFFQQGDRLSYFIPNRLTDSHGLSIHGIDRLAEKGITLIVTCDTGSTNLAEIDHANRLGIDIIVTDHHTLAEHRPDVVAIINPRSLPMGHPLAHLSGVAVGYKLVEALYNALPTVPTQPLHALLDLVAIGLIADLVELKGDCRYLAQMGIRQLQTQVTHPTRPGIAELLKYCRRSGDRPTDISFGIGPRINAISRIYGDAHFCVELLTSTDVERCRELAEATELANVRRKALQRDVEQQVMLKLAELDLSTTGVIVLADAQWPVGVLGLVAGKIAQTYGRPTILLNTSTVEASTSDAAASAQGHAMARGSARSVNSINLYELVKSQAHLLQGFGGHPFAAGLSLRTEDVVLFADAINQEFRARYGTAIAQHPVVNIDLTARVADLGKSLFRELNVLEPYGMGNPIPKLVIRHCWFKKVWNQKIRDLTNRKLNYIKTTFEIWDDSVDQGFHGTWWGHYKEDIPDGRCDAVVELDYNSAPYGNRKPRYEVRLIAVRRAMAAASPYRVVSSTAPSSLHSQPSQLILDWRSHDSNPSSSEDIHSDGGSADDVKDTNIASDGSKAHPVSLSASDDDGYFSKSGQYSESDLSLPVEVSQCPATWRDFYEGIHKAQRQQTPLAIAFPPPIDQTPLQIWQRFVGIAKYLSRTQVAVSSEDLQETLSIGERSLQLGLSALSGVGFAISPLNKTLIISSQSPASYGSEADTEIPDALKHIQQFITAVAEEQFHQRFFHEVPTSTLQTAADEFLTTLRTAPESQTVEPQQ